MSSILYRVIESNIFDVSHCRRTGSVLPRTRALNVLHKFARVNMDGDYYTCPRHCCATEKCNKSCAVIIIATYTLKSRSHRCLAPLKLGESRQRILSRSHCERIDHEFISIISSTRSHSTSARSNKRAFRI